MNNTSDVQVPADGERHRKSLDLLLDTWDELATVAKKHKITQGEVIDIMTRLLKNSSEAGELYDQQRATKVAARQPKKELSSLLRGLTPEQTRAAIEAAKKASR